MLIYKAQVRKLFHAHIKIKIPVFCNEGLFDELFAILEDVDRNYNSYSEGSFFDKINKHAGDFVEVDAETLHILDQVLFFSGLFDGEYDITVMPLIRLWGFYKDEKRILPSRLQIDKTRSLVDFKKIEIKGSQVRIAKEQEIITGSFMKAYAVDKLVDRIKKIGVSDAIINAGGSTIRAVNNKVHPTWTIDVKNAHGESDLFKIRLSDSCFSTSAQDKIFVEMDGQKYGHILSPITGFPSTNRQVGIISENCFVGDVISTGLFNQSPQGFIEKMNILKERYNISGFLVDGSGNLTCTEDFQKNIINN